MRYASITDRLSNLGSGKWAVHAAARAMAAAGTEIIELTIGEPDMPPDEALLAECARAMHAGRTRYSNGRGEPAVLKALTEKYRKRRADVTEKNILCFPGTQTALFAVMLGLVEAGDAVLCRCIRKSAFTCRRRIWSGRSRRNAGFSFSTHPIIRPGRF